MNPSLTSDPVWVRVPRGVLPKGITFVGLDHPRLSLSFSANLGPLGWSFDFAHRW